MSSSELFVEALVRLPWRGRRQRAIQALAQAVSDRRESEANLERERATIVEPVRRIVRTENHVARQIRDGLLRGYDR